MPRSEEGKPINMHSIQYWTGLDWTGSMPAMAIFILPSDSIVRLDWSICTYRAEMLEHVLSTDYSGPESYIPE